MLLLKSHTRTKLIRFLQNSIMSLHTDNCKIVAVAQLTSTNDKEKNYKSLETLVRAAKRQNALMVFLPEASDYLCDNLNDVVKLAESIDGPLLGRCKKLAQDCNIWISIGVHLKFSDTKVSNAQLIISDKGNIVDTYEKLHTFDVQLSDHSVNESSYVEKGKKIVPPINTPVGKVGLSVCYDLRFPEIGVALTQMGADILSYPSAFMFETGALHWETLLRARAIENQCYVIAAAQTGFNTSKTKTWGHSIIIDPLGTIVTQCSDGEGVSVTTIDFELLKRVRSNMPLQSQRRFDIYPKLANLRPLSESKSYQFGQVVISAETVFYRTIHTIAFVNKRCAVPGHVLVTPIRVAKRFSDLDSFEVSDLFQTVQRVQSVMEKVHGTSSSTIIVQDGPDAGQTIWHLHVHILPRKPNDFPDNDDVYRVLQKHKEQSDWREEEDMIKEAQCLKTYFL